MGSKIKLTPRLKAAADLIRPGARLADVGTDHAYVPVYLVQNGVCPCAIASDLKKGPLENAEQTVLHYGLAPLITLRRSDGLRRVREDEVDDILIAGMGGILIAEILEAAPWTRSKGKHLVLQPMTHVEILRKHLRENGFAIQTEVIAQEDRRLYCLIEAQFTGYAPPKSPDYDYVGELDAGHSLHRAYLLQQKKLWQKKYEGLKKAGRPEEAEQAKEILSYYPEEEEQ